MFIIFTRSEIVVCKPNPCKNNGICSIVTNTEYSCNCNNTGYCGKNCEQLIIHVSSISKMHATTKSSPITLTSQPKSYIDIMLLEADNVVAFDNSKHRITSSSKQSTFTANSSKAGLFWLTFDIKSQQFIQPLKRRLLFFNSVGAIKGKNVKSLLDFEKNCYLTDFYDKSNCNKSITFSSTAWWEKTQNGLLHTTGIVFVKIKSQTFPILLSKVSMSEYLSDIKTDINISIIRQPNRDECAEMKLSDDQILYSIQNDLFARDFIHQFNKLTPRWFSLQIEGTMKNIHIDNIRAYLWNGKEVNANQHCTGAAIDESSIFLVYLHYEKLTMKAHEKTAQMITNDKFCLIVEACSGEPHLVVPKDNYGKIERIFSFHELLDIGWSVNVKAIGFKKLGLECSRSSSQIQVAFGTASMNYQYKTVVKGEVQGNLFYNLVTKNGKQVF